MLRFAVSIRSVRVFIIAGVISFLKGEKKALVNGVLNDDMYKAEIERPKRIIGKQVIKIEILKKGGTVRERIEA